MIDAIITRLQAKAMPPLMLVDGMARYAALQAAPAMEKRPAAFVLPLAEGASANQLGANALDQKVAARFAVVLMVGGPGDITGGRNMLGLPDTRAALRDALIGWTPPDCLLPVTFVAGDLLDLRGGVVSWQDTFETTYRIRRLGANP